MKRRAVGEQIVSLYPEDIRAARGEELISTLLDAGEESTLSFVREAASLLLAALSSRSRTGAHQPLGDLIRGALGWAAVLTIGYVLMVSVVDQVWSEGLSAWGPVGIWTQFLAPMLVLAAFITHRDRVAGMFGLLWWIAEVSLTPSQGLTGWVAFLVLPVVGFAVLTIAPDRRPDSGRGLIVVPLFALAVFRWTVLGTDVELSYLLPLLVAVAFITVKPPLALGTAFVFSSFAVGFYPLTGTSFLLLTGELTACTPITIGLIAVGRRNLRTRPKA